MDSKKEIVAIRQYVIDQHSIAVAENVNEIEGFKANFKCQKIKIFFSKHLIFKKYLMDEIDISKVIALIGVNERDCYRYLNRQRLAFINYINSIENDLDIIVKRKEQNYEKGKI